MLSIKTFLVLTSILVQTRGSLSSDCGEGHVRDLDGSCVTKFVIPKKKAVCPKVTIDNGEIFLLGTGRMVQFYCDTGYVRVPDIEVAICQVLGQWSKMVPVCLKPGCQVSRGGRMVGVNHLYKWCFHQCIKICRGLL